jgi:selenium metabolism protein YedF
MVEKSIDLRGLACPQPVLKAKAILDDKAVDCLTALVDDDVTVQNLDRLCKYFQASFSCVPLVNGFQITISRKNDITISANAPTAKIERSVSQTTSQSKETEADTIIFLAKDTFGQGDADFSRTLTNVFLQTILQAGHPIQAILLANTGVKLMASDSPCLKVFEDFQKQGTEVLACGLCVEFYGLSGQIPKTQITNMFAIVEYMFAAKKIVSP